MDVASGYCVGCYRTIEEIADWGQLTDQARRHIWLDIRERRVRESARESAGELAPEATPETDPGPS